MLHFLQFYFVGAGRFFIGLDVGFFLGELYKMPMY